MLGEENSLKIELNNCRIWIYQLYICIIYIKSGWLEMYFSKPQYKPIYLITNVNIQVYLLLTGISCCLVSSHLINLNNSPLHLCTPSLEPPPTSEPSSQVPILQAPTSQVPTSQVLSHRYLYHRYLRHRYLPHMYLPTYVTSNYLIDIFLTGISNLFVI